MTIYSFKQMYKEKNPDGHWFDKDTLKFFGEKLSEMKVLNGTYKVTDWMGNECEAYCVRHKQRPPYGEPFWKETYFDVNTMENILMDN